MVASIRAVLPLLLAALAFEIGNRARAALVCPLVIARTKAVCPSLSEPPPHTRWGVMKNIARADVLDAQKSTFDPSGALFEAALKPNHGDVPPFFVASGTEAFFVSEVGRKAMLDSGLTGFAFEEVKAK